MMILKLERIAKRDNYTIGRLYVNGKYFADTIEDKDRGISNSDTLERIKEVKVPSYTAIPTGRYQITMDVVSPKFSQKSYYKNFCGGKLPRLLGVKGFEGILIHKGVNADSSAGCIIVGKNTIVGAVTNSQYYFEQLYKVLQEANTKGEKIEIEIV